MKSDVFRSNVEEHDVEETNGRIVPECREPQRLI